MEHNSSSEELKLQKCEMKCMQWAMAYKILTGTSRRTAVCDLCTISHVSEPSQNSGRIKQTDSVESCVWPVPDGYSRYVRRTFRYNVR